MCATHPASASDPAPELLVKAHGAALTRHKAIHNYHRILLVIDTARERESEQQAVASLLPDPCASGS